MEGNAKFPEKLEFLFHGKRYKVAYWGREGVMVDGRCGLTEIGETPPLEAARNVEKC
jgi:hypothetical protein